MPALRIRVGLVVNPVMKDLPYISSMPALSAPSAKIFTLSSEIVFISISFRYKTSAGSESNRAPPLASELDGPADLAAALDSRSLSEWSYSQPCGQSQYPSSDLRP